MKTKAPGGHGKVTGANFGVEDKEQYFFSANCNVCHLNTASRFRNKRLCEPKGT